MPSTKDLIKAKISALKAEIEPDSISPSYLGEILDDMVDEHDNLHPDKLSHITIAGMPDQITVSVGTDDHSVSGRIPGASDNFAGAMTAAMKRKLDKAAVPKYIEFDGIADRVTPLEVSTMTGSTTEGYKVIFVRSLNTFLLCYGIPDPEDEGASGFNNWADGDDFGTFSENGRVPYAKTLYLDRSSDILYKLADDGQLVQLGSRFSSLSLGSDKRKHIVKALDVSGATIASVSIPKAPESPVKILAQGICRPTSDPRCAYRLHNNPGYTVIYKLPNKLASEQLREQYIQEYGPDITVFDVTNLLDFDAPEYGSWYSWRKDDMNAVNTVLKKFLAGWEKDRARVSAETYTEDSAPAGWTPVWKHHLIILNRYDYPHEASYMLATDCNVHVLDNVYIFRDEDGRLKRAYNVIPQQSGSASDDITLSIVFDAVGRMYYKINDNSVCALRNGCDSKIRDKKRLRRTCKYEIEWYRRCTSTRLWYSREFSAAILDGLDRKGALEKALADGILLPKGTYRRYGKWRTDAIPKRSGMVRIRKRATEIAPAGRWNYFIVRGLDNKDQGRAWVKKIRGNVKRLGVSKHA